MLQQPKSKIIVIPIAICLIIVGINIYFSDRLKLAILPKIYYSKTKTPEMYLVPITREVNPSAEAFSTCDVLSYEKAKFKVPWVLREKIEMDRSTLFAFMNRKGIQIEQQITTNCLKSYS